MAYILIYSRAEHIAMAVYIFVDRWTVLWEKLQDRVTLNVMVADLVQMSQLFPHDRWGLVLALPAICFG